MAVNLNNLIMSDGDEEVVKEPPLLAISKKVENSLPEQNSDSDSSFSEYAKETAKNIPNLMQEVIQNRIEKNNRINQARYQKAKDLEEKQRSFKRGGQYNRTNQKNKNTKTVHNSKPDISSKKNFKTSENNQVQKVSGCRKYSNNPSTSKTNYSNKEGKCDIIANENAACFNKPNKAQKNVKSSSNPGNIVADSDLSAKLRNITLQEFDIDSTDSSDYESDDSSNNLSEHEHLKGRLKLFTTKNLNRGAFEIIDVDNNMESSEDDSDSDDDAVMKPKGVNTGRSYWSAEKSSAVQKRKRSNYLKKRDFRHNQKLLKKDQNQPVFDESTLKDRQLDGSSSNKNEFSISNKQSCAASDVNTSSIKTTNKQRTTHIKQYETTDVQSSPGKITEKNIKHKGSKRHNNYKDSETVDGTKPNVKIKKNDESNSYLSNSSTKNPSTSKESTKIDKTKDKCVISAIKTKKNERKDFKLKEKLKKGDMYEEMLIKAQNQRIIVKNRSDGLENLIKPKSTDDSIVVLSEVYLKRKDPSNSDTAQVKTVENVMDSILKTSSDNEVGVSLYKCTESEILKINLGNSASDSDDIDFNTILNQRKEKQAVAVSENSGSDLNPVKVIGISKKDDESSSDYEAEFEACLTNTKLKFCSNLNK